VEDALLFLRTGCTAVTVNDCTLGGIAACHLVNQGHAVGGSGSAAVELWIAAVPTGTTATVAFNTSHTCIRAGASVWAVYDLISTTATDTAPGTGDPIALNVDTTVGSLVFAAAMGASAAGTTTATWTGLTENGDTTVEAVQTGITAASATTETPRTMSVNFSTTIGVGAGVCAVLV
jgi:hypothetical protein